MTQELVLGIAALALVLVGMAGTVFFWVWRSGKSSGGGLVRDGGNTTEGTTTSTTVVAILTASSLSIAVGTPVHAMCCMRRSADVGSSSGAGVKVNSTQARSSISWDDGQAAVRNGFWEAVFIYGVSSYLSSGHVTSSGEEATQVQHNFNADMPTATLTDVVHTGESSNASNTTGADELHVYSSIVS